MGQPLTLRVLGFPLTIDPFFFLVVSLLGMGQGRDPAAFVAWIVVALVSIVGHELGHALAFRRFGLPSRIHLHAMGGVTSPTAPARISPRQHVLISLAGPVPGILIGGLILAFAQVSSPYSLGEWIILDLAFANLFWGLFNLVPVLPLDGGQVVAGLVARWHRSGAIAVILSAVVAGSLVALCLVAGQPFAAIFFGFLAWVNGNEYMKSRRPSPPATAAGLLAEGYVALESGARLAAAQRANEVLAGATSIADRDGAVNLLMWNHLLAGEPEGAADVVAEHPPWNPLAPLMDPRVVRAAGGMEAAVELLQRAFDMRPGDATRTQLARGLVELGRLDDAVVLVDGGRATVLDNRSVAVVGAGLFNAGRYTDAARLGEASFARTIDSSMAYNVARAWARAGRGDDALVWLHRAVDAGFSNAVELDADPNLAALRDLPAFHDVRARLAPTAADES